MRLWRCNDVSAGWERKVVGVIGMVPFCCVHARGNCVPPMLAFDQIGKNHNHRSLQTRENTPWACCYVFHSKVPTLIGLFCGSLIYFIWVASGLHGLPLILLTVRQEQ